MAPAPKPIPPRKPIPPVTKGPTPGGFETPDTDIWASRPALGGSFEAFVHRLVAAGHEVHIQAKPINQPRRRA